MKALMMNSVSLAALAWLALFDHCIIHRAGIPAPRTIYALIIYQLAGGTLALLLANGKLPLIAEWVRENRSARAFIFVVGVPSIIFLVSPALMSLTLNQAQLGYTDRILVNAHVAYDLRCCVNPFAFVDSPK